jgi:Ca2+-binding RTX toxin-like protein
MTKNIALVRVVALATLAVVLTAATNVILGTAGPDDLIGTLGDDTINGLGGDDTMTGLAGNDTYYVNTPRDVIVEDVGGGRDTVRSSAGLHTMRANVENLVLIEDGANGVGNELANRIVGNARSNEIDGRKGNDVLLGSAGPDTFTFRSPLNASTNLDQLPDFDDVEDSFKLFWTAFPSFTIYHAPLCQGAYCLLPELFHVGPSATDTVQRIVYNPTTGLLMYDRDGTGPLPAVAFARLPPDLALTASHFRVRPKPTI